MRSSWLILPGFVLLAACASLVGGPRPAHIVEHSAASHGAVQEAVERALGSEVVLSEDVLTDSNMLVLEHAAERNRARVQGRELSRPERFFLLRRDDECLLEHERTGQRYPLPETRCEFE